ncbi:MULTISPECIES: hypothetical protein [Corynebacterium]|nr:MULTISPECIES: hypothetical protein [Corynebacterium]MCT1427384.1 hypothetical protein [Corynebacterium sp. p3-SID1241]MDV2427525.1 hypothetical protein [Corynebacterium tuberculostearicum]WKE57506.1 hypothetical protein J8247_00795 [Corynebacterium tuberculostearicum]
MENNKRRDSAAASTVALAALFTASIAAESSGHQPDSAAALPAPTWLEEY